MKTEALERYLNSFGKQIVKQAKGNLSAAGKGGALSNSIDFFVIRKGGSITVRFKMNSYGTFVDKGVSGTNKTKSFKDYKGKVIKSPYKFGTGSSKVGKAKGGMSGIMAKWVKKKGFQWRDENGRFMSHKSMGYIIARSIYSKGIQGISFFQKPLMLGMKQFSSKFGKAIADDIVNSLRQQKIA